MPKRKSASKEKTLDAAGSSDSDSDPTTASLVDVSFEYFDPRPVDFHGLKTLLRQLFDVDAALFDLSGLADLILSQPLLGSTVKVDDKDSDPYSFLTVLNLGGKKENSPLHALHNYLHRHAPSDSLLSQLLDPSATPPPQIGLVLTERFLNMPPQTVPPMYKMLLEEVQWAVEASEPYSFTHYLVLSKTYDEVPSELAPPSTSPRTSKKAKKAKQAEKDSALFYFHPEDEVLQKYAVASARFDFETSVEEGSSDSKRTFQELGVKPAGLMVLIEAAKLGEAVEAASSFLAT